MRLVFMKASRSTTRPPNVTFGLICFAAAGSAWTLSPFLTVADQVDASRSPDSARAAASASTSGSKAPYPCRAASAPARASRRSAQWQPSSTGPQHARHDVLPDVPQTRQQMCADPARQGSARRAQSIVRVSGWLSAVFPLGRKRPCDHDHRQSHMQIPVCVIHVDRPNSMSSGTTKPKRRRRHRSGRRAAVRFRERGQTGEDQHRAAADMDIVVHRIGDEDAFRPDQRVRKESGGAGKNEDDAQDQGAVLAVMLSSPVTPPRTGGFGADCPPADA